MQQSGIEAALHQHVTQRLGRCHAASRRLPKDSIAGREPLQCLHSGQKQRIIRGPDDEHDTQRLARGLRSNPAKPEWAGVSAEPLRSENPPRLALEKAAGLGQRQNLRDQGIGHIAMECAGLLTGNTLRDFDGGCGNAVASPAQDGKTSPQA